MFSSFWLTGLALLMFIYVLKRFNEWNAVARVLRKLPGPMMLPIIGSAYLFFGVSREKMYDRILELSGRYPRIFCVWVGMSPEVHLSKAEYAEKILREPKHLQKSYVYDFIRPWLGDGLLISSGDRWHQHRKIITPTFHFGILEGFCHIFAEQSSVLVNKLEKYAGTGVAVNVCPYVTLATLDIICETAMGTKINAQDSKDSAYVTAIYDMSDKAFQRIFKPWLANEFIYGLTEDGKVFAEDLEIVHTFTNSVIEERRKQRNSDKTTKGNAKLDVDEFGKRKNKAFLDLLLDAHEIDNRLSLDDIRQEVDTFMFEGHDTTTAGITWTLLCVGNHPEVQKLVFEELHSVFGDTDRPATIQDLSELKYLDRVIKETLRFYPSVPLMGRVSSEDVEIAGYQIPKNTFIAIHVHEIMNDPDHFPNPEKFDPDRFLPGNSSNRHPYAYIPFSAGPRNCVGQKFAMLEEKSLISTILRKYRIKSAKKMEDINLMSELILRSRDGIEIYFEKR